MHTHSPYSVWQLTRIALCMALLAVCSFISISIPPMPPFTLQTFAVFFVAGWLGRRDGCTAVFLYLCMGMLGLPVFAGFRGGIAVLMQQTGGYLVGFLPAAFLAATFLEHGRCHSFRQYMLAFAAGLLVCYLFGTIWFWLWYSRTTGAIGIGTVLSYCVFPYVLPDTAKLALAAVCVCRIPKRHTV